MTFLDYLAMCIGGGAGLAILMAPFVALVWFFERRKRHRLAKWQSLGLARHTSTWKSLLGRETLTGQYRGRALTIYTMPDQSYEQQRMFTRIRIGIRCPPGSRLRITPIWPSIGLGAWLDRLIAPKRHEIKDHFSVQSDPPDLAARLLVLPRISTLLFSDPKPAIELSECELWIDRLGNLPDPQDAHAVLDMACDLAGLIEQVVYLSCAV